MLAENCDINKCVRVPASCTSSYDCDFIAVYKHDGISDYVDIAISSTKAFAAFGQSSNNAVGF